MVLDNVFTEKCIDPKSVNAYNYRGILKYQLGDTEGAIADFNLAIVINPQYPDIHKNRAIAKQDIGDIQGSCSDFKKCRTIIC